MAYKLTHTLKQFLDDVARGYNHRALDNQPPLVEIEMHGDRVYIRYDGKDAELRILADSFDREF